MSEVITIMVGNKIWLTYHPESGLYSHVAKFHGIPQTLIHGQSLSSISSTISLASTCTQQKPVPRLLIKQKLFQTINFSSFWSGNDNYKRYQLNSVDSWIPDANNIKMMDTVWIQIVCNKLFTFVGLKIQGRGWADYKNQMVTKFKVLISDDGEYYHQTFKGKQFRGCTQANKIQTIMFDYPIKTKFMRVNPTAYDNHPSMRFDALVIKNQ